MTSGVTQIQAEAPIKDVSCMNGLSKNTDSCKECNII